MEVANSGIRFWYFSCYCTYFFLGLMLSSLNIAFFKIMMQIMQYLSLQLQHRLFDQPLCTPSSPPMICWFLGCHAHHTSSCQCHDLPSLADAISKCTYPCSDSSCQRQNHQSLREILPTVCITSN